MSNTAKYKVWKIHHHCKPYYMVAQFAAALFAPVVVIIIGG